MYVFRSLVFYLITTILTLKAFSLVWPNILRGDNALCIVFCHLNKVVQVHKLFG